MFAKLGILVELERNQRNDKGRKKSKLKNEPRPMSTWRVLPHPQIFQTEKSTCMPNQRMW